MPLLYHPLPTRTPPHKRKATRLTYLVVRESEVVHYASATSRKSTKFFRNSFRARAK